MGVWGLSYSSVVAVVHEGSVRDGSTLGIRVEAREGLLRVEYVHWEFIYAPHPGWRAEWYDPWPPLRSTLHLLDGDFLGFTIEIVKHEGRALSDWHVFVPIWCPTLLLTLASSMAWCKVFRRKNARGFPVEPVASQREGAGG